ncbi:M15 family metallopeptidase [Cellulomonas triticagri]|uniref:D-alanyl-D-alanine carboxypeptidase-like core domain-containing protein n=1 Tax=Cellulomonas triticagri TaxID=2483352 RepID=A0A3M2IWM6_9CELL|nr:M15 family metallopeptidase [Cellulomonas triticagri]RMI03723.1 hypothetical protein EBM89_18565 [Cellulomonas triticagri]
MGAGLVAVGAAKAAGSKKTRRRVLIGCGGALVAVLAVVLVLASALLGGLMAVLGGADEAEGLASAAATETPSAPAGTGSGGGGAGGQWGGHSNGRIPAEQLCSLSWAPAMRLRCDAAAALEGVNGAYRAAFGANISITDAYRDYDAQVRVKASKGWLAATPGTSNHGWGLAVDLGGGINKFGTPQHNWMRTNAGAHGWVLPGWAQQGGSKPEAWHFEYVGATR